MAHFTCEPLLARAFPLLAQQFLDAQLNQFDPDQIEELLALAGAETRSDKAKVVTPASRWNCHGCATDAG